MNSGRNRERQGGQTPVDEDHRRDGRDDRDDIGERAAGRVRDDRLDATQSLDRRLWISPVRVSVKKRSGMRWRWLYKRVAQVLHYALADDVC